MNRPSPSSKKQSRERSDRCPRPVSLKGRKRSSADQTLEWAKNLGSHLEQLEVQVRRAIKASIAGPKQEEKTIKSVEMSYAEQYELNIRIYELLQEASEDDSDVGRDKP